MEAVGEGRGERAQGLATHNREGAQQSAAGPGNDAKSNNVFARKAISKEPKYRRAEHIADDEYGLQEAIFRVTHWAMEPTAHWIVQLLQNACERKEPATPTEATATCSCGGSTLFRSHAMRTGNTLAYDYL